AIVVRFLLGAHRAGLAPRRIEQARLLFDAATVFDDIDLAAGLHLDGLTNKANRVDVLDLAARAKLFDAFADHRDIDVGTQVTFFHVTVAGAEIAQDRAQLRDIGLRLLGRAQV